MYMWKTWIEIFSWRLDTFFRKENTLRIQSWYIYNPWFTHNPIFKKNPQKRGNSSLPMFKSRKSILNKPIKWKQLRDSHKLQNERGLLCRPDKHLLLSIQHKKCHSKLWQNTTIWKMTQSGNLQIEVKFTYWQQIHAIHPVLKILFT